jgi:outer membrane protein OmpA-like peptidoglycan-associated protein
LWGFSPNVGSYKPSIGFDFGVGYTFFFNPRWGISTGASAAFFNSKYALPTFRESYPANDGTNGAFNGISDFEYHYTANGYTEKQQALLLNIPLMLHFEKGKYYAAVGGKVGLPLGTLTYKNSLNELQASGVFNGTRIETPESMGFGTFSNLAGSGELKQLSPAFFASAEAGVKWKLTSDLSLYTGAYIDYGLNKIGEIGDEKFIDYTAANFYTNSEAKYRPTGILLSKAAETGKPFVDKVFPASVGIRITLAFRKASAKKQPDVLPPVEQTDTQPTIAAASPPPTDTSSTDDKRAGWSEEKVEDVKRLQQPINFELNKSDLRDDSRAAVDAEIQYLKRRLDEKARILKKYPELQVRIEGHTCDIGTEARNQELGSERAEIVAEYMLEKGIPNEVIAEVVSKSYFEPLVPNTSEENRRRNRRVVILVVNE